MGQQQILRIFGQLFRSRLRALPIGCGHHHQLIHVLHVPAALTELHSQPVQQFADETDAAP